MLGGLSLIYVPVAKWEVEPRNNSEIEKGWYNIMPDKYRFND